VRGDGVLRAPHRHARRHAAREGTELYLVGQKAQLARYPIHWHVAQDVAGQYARRNSIWRSFNRCVTVHGSHAATVEGNVCHDHLGHGYFLEDGIETRNTIAGNLGVFGRAPLEADRVLPSDRAPASFWITTPPTVARQTPPRVAGVGGSGTRSPEAPDGDERHRPGCGRGARRWACSPTTWRTPTGAAGIDATTAPRPDGTTSRVGTRRRETPGAESPAVRRASTGSRPSSNRGRAVWLRGRSHRWSSPCSPTRDRPRSRRASPTSSAACWRARRPKRHAVPGRLPGARLRVLRRHGGGAGDALRQLSPVGARPGERVRLQPPQRLPAQHAELRRGRALRPRRGGVPRGRGARQGRRQGRPCSSTATAR
jgi:hypothetical protein